MGDSSGGSVTSKSEVTGMTRALSKIGYLLLCRECLRTAVRRYLRRF